ncbi:UBX domain-containing protein 2A isoform X1 [Gadus morhua]|uniref:UBX domain protein 2A n=1 Tax=Gadus morhua TaxID=8049 RepID=A0A8C5A2L9_GADMO|nr:UBX domain-containing protein 2A isoform X1 [Gadus morhua]
MKNIDNTESGNDDNCDESEEVPMRRSFSVEDLLDEVEKICYDAPGTSKVEMVVRLWKDGFTINDQEFRSYATPENQDFLDTIKRGELPLEWESRAEEEELEINVEDLTEELYVPRKKAFHAFSGHGYRLGSVAPRVVARSPSVHEEGESPPIPMVTLDHALPVTSLQIWLADGRRLVQRFNLSHRVSDVHDFVSRCQRTCPPFVLTTSLPSRVLCEGGLSLEEADLAHAVIVQRPLDTEAPFGQSS